MSDKESPKKILPPAEWLASLPSKRMATQVIYTNLEHEILLVKPNYRDDWLLPGGIIEAGESPLQGATREITEELGFVPEFLVFGGIDYNPEKKYPGSDFLHVFFYGGYLGADDIARITKEDDELDDLKFVPMDQLADYANPQQCMRIRGYMQSYPSPILLDEGRRMDIIPGGQSLQYVHIVSAVLLEDNGKYLMVQEAQASARGLWSLPSGRVDAGEDMETAAIREAREEAGVEVELDGLLKIIHVDYRSPVVHVFSATKFTGDPRPQEGEILQVGWFSLDELRAMKSQLRGIEYTLNIVEEYENAKQ